MTWYEPDEGHRQWIKEKIAEAVQAEAPAPTSETVSVVDNGDGTVTITTTP